MSFNSKRFIEYHEALLEPDNIIYGCSSKLYQEITPMQAKNRWLSSLNAEQREQLRREYEEEQIKNQHRL